MPQPRRLVQGNEACAEGAIAAGARFYAGYPITPSTEIAEHLARRLPEVGGTFIQMEDEIASMAAIIGASLAGTKSLTATSGRMACTSTCPQSATSECVTSERMMANKNGGTRESAGKRASTRSNGAGANRDKRRPSASPISAHATAAMPRKL